MCLPPPIPRAKQVVIMRGRHHRRKCGPVLFTGVAPIQVRKGVAVQVTQVVAGACPP